MILAGKVAVVTGASRGLGFEISRRFLQEGASILICARTSSDLLLACKELEKEAPGRVLAATADVARDRRHLYLNGLRLLVVALR